MSDSITPETVLDTIHAPRNRRRVIWSGSRLLDRMGVARYPDMPTNLRTKAARILKQLWREGKLVRRVDMLNDHRIPEVAYMRIEDKPVLFFQACSVCGFPCLVRHGHAEACRKCNGEDVDENTFYPIFTSPLA